MYANAYALRWIDRRSAGTSNSRILRPHRESVLRDVDDEELEVLSQPLPPLPHGGTPQQDDRQLDLDSEQSDVHTSSEHSLVGDASAHIPDLRERVATAYGTESSPRGSPQPGPSCASAAHTAQTYRSRIFTPESSQSSSFESLRRRRRRRAATKLPTSSESGSSVQIPESSASLNLPSVHFESPTESASPR